MLHLILGILKVIGILLLVLLGLLLLAVLALLFVPVRYELNGKKKEGAAAARAKVSWLLGLVSATAGYRDGRLQVRLKLLCFSVFRFGTGREKNGAGGDFGKREKTSAPAASGEAVPPPETLWEEPEPELRREAKPEPELHLEAKPTPESELHRKPKPSWAQGKWKKILRLIARAAEFLFSLPERMTDLLNRIQEFFLETGDQKERLESRLEELQSAVEPYTSKEAVSLYRRIFGHLKNLWKHYAPRSLSGWIHFGTGAPDLTGWLAGLIYLILPASAEAFEVRPDFTEQTLEADVTMKGHIRACHLLRTAFWLWRDKELRKMIRRIKGGN